MAKTFLFVDVETTGKNYEGATWRNNELLSISYMITNEQLEVQKTNSFVLHHEPKVVYDMNEYILNMHTKTGLIPAIFNSKVNKDDVENQMLKDLEDYKETTIIPAGNNIQFDVEVIRRYLPKVFETFHYSFLDVTSVRKALSLIMPYEIGKIKEQKKLNHQSIIDCEDARNELVAMLKWIKQIQHLALAVNPNQVF